jgi:hypothetical protein
MVNSALEFSPHRSTLKFDFDGLCMPNLRNVVFRFPDSAYELYTAGGDVYASRYRVLLGDRQKLYKAMGDFFRRGGKINAFEFSDVRDYNKPDEWHCGLMDYGVPRFGPLTMDLNRLFGFDCHEETTPVWKPEARHDTDKKNWAYNTRETWKVGRSESLIWNSDVEEELYKIAPDWDEE